MITIARVDHIFKRGIQTVFKAVINFELRVGFSFSLLPYNIIQCNTMVQATAQPQNYITRTFRSYVDMELSMKWLGSDQKQAFTFKLELPRCILLLLGKYMTALIVGCGAKMACCL